MDRDESVSGSGSDEPASDRPRQGRRSLLLTFVTSVAVLAAVTSGVFWWRARADPVVTDARQRDVALEAGKRHLVEINTLDYHEPEAGLGRWQRQVTGPLAAEIAKNRKDNVRSLREARTVTKAKVLDGAVTRLDTTRGTASTIAAVEVTVVPDGGKPVTKRSRIDGELTRTGQDWKLSSVQVVGLSG